MSVNSRVIESASNSHKYKENSSKSTSQYIQNEVHVSGEGFDVLHASNGPDGNKLITVHLGYQVQVLREVLSANTQNPNIVLKKKK